MSNSQFDHDEFKESYAHYRHLEQERSRHLAFFFAMVGGLLGFLGFLLKDGKPVTGLDWFLFVGGLIVVFLQILDTVTFTAIRRIGDARAQHAATMDHLREKLNSDTYVSDLWKAFKKRAHVSVQCAAEITLHLFALLFVTTASVGAIYALTTGAVFCWQGAVVLSLTTAFAVLHAAVWVWLRPPRKSAT
jgi:hypothetical protein